MLEMEWTHAYANKTPKAEDFRNAMLAAGLQQCPRTFRKHGCGKRPGRAAITRLRPAQVRRQAERPQGRLQGKLFKINPRVHPPIPFTTKVNKFHAWIRAHAETPKAILEALAALRAQIMGLTPGQLARARQSIERVMLEFTLAYMETAICMDTAGIRESQVRELFASIRTEGCPEDFRRAWQHDLPFFLKGSFTGLELTLSAVCKKYGADEQELFLKVRRKMKEWDIQPPTPQTQDAFRRDMREIRENMLGGR